jgi:hypothetical protein
MSKTTLPTASSEILKVLLQTWLAAVKHSANLPLQEIGEKLFPDKSNGEDIKKTLERWKKGENKPPYKTLKYVADNALSQRWISEQLNELILSAYEDFYDNPRGSVNAWNMRIIVQLFEEFMLNEGEPQSLIDQLDALGYLVYGPTDENNPEFDSWLAIWKPFYLACESQNLDEYLNLIAIMDYADLEEKYGGKRPENMPTTNKLKRLRESQPDKELIKKIISQDIVDFMARISEMDKEMTPYKIAFAVGQPYSMGIFLARGEIIPSYSDYRRLEKMAAYTVGERLGVVRLSPLRRERQNFTNNLMNKIKTALNIES